MKNTLKRKRGPASTLLTALMAIFLFLGVFARGQEAPDPEKVYTYEPYTCGSASGVIITAYLGNEEHVTTPTSLGGQPVIAIGPGVPREVIAQGMGPRPDAWKPKAFSNTYVTSLTVSEGVLFIADAGLANGYLTSISLPASLQDMGGNPFFGRYEPNTGLVITVAPGNANFAIEANSGALIKNGTHLIFWPTLAARAAAVEGLLTIPNGVTHIGTRILAWNQYKDPETNADVYAFTRIAFPAGVTHIADYAFLECELESLTLPTSLTSLGLWVSDNELQLPANLAQLTGHPCPTYAITLDAGNTHFRMVDDYLLNSAGDVLYATANAPEPPPEGTTRAASMPGTVKRIAPLAMCGADVSGLELPSGLETIDEGAFADSHGWSVAPTVLPDSVTSIAENAFYDADFAGALPAGLTTLGKYAFANCNMMNIVTPPNLKVIPEGCFSRFPDNSNLHIILSEGLESIGKDAFLGCGVSTILLPASLKNIDPRAFSGIPMWGEISPLIAYEVAPGNTHLKADNGVLFSADGKKLLACPQSKTPSYRIPDGTEEIGPYAFANSYLAGFNDNQPIASFLMVPASVTTLYVSSFSIEAWDTKPANAYFLGAAPEFAEADGWPGHIVFNYSSLYQESWEAKLDEGIEPLTYGGYVVNMISGTVVIPTLVRQDGVSGDDEPLFRNQLVLLAGMESTDTGGVTLRYTLDGNEPTGDSPAVENGIITLLGGYTTVSLAPFRALGDGEALCGPIIMRNYIDSAAINAALDNDQLVFSTNAAIPWFPTNTNDYSGATSDCMRSFTGNFNFGASWLQTSVTGPGVLSFWWKGADRWEYLGFAFDIDGVNQFTYSGESGWCKEYFSIGEGQHTLSWSVSTNANWDMYYYYLLDRVDWTPASQAGFVYEQVEGGLKLIAYSGADAHVIIPDEGDGGQTISEIDAEAFAWNPYVQSITFPTQAVNVLNYDSANGLKSCRNLDSILFPGAPPDAVPQVPFWTRVYYPYDYDEAHGTGDGSWTDYLFNWAGWYNSGTVFLPIAFPTVEAPVISHPDQTRGTASAGFTGTLQISFASAPGTLVRYTTDGSVPDAESPSASPLTISTTTIITARAFRNIAGVDVPCSVVTRRTFVNTDEFNAAVGLGMEGFSFTTLGDQPWINKVMANSIGTEAPAVGTERLHPGQSSSLFLDFTMEEEGLVSFEQFYSYSQHDYSKGSFVIYDDNENEVPFDKTAARLNYSRWWKHTLDLPAGSYTAVWTLTVPDTDFSGPDLAIRNFRAGSQRCSLTLLSEPEAGGKTYANDVLGSIFDFIVGQDVLIRAEENDHYKFTQWSDGHEYPQRTITIEDPTDQVEDPNTYTAQFVEAAYITAVAQPDGGGSVYGGNHKYQLDEAVTLWAYNSYGYRFNRWLDDEDDPPTIPYERSFTCTAADRDRTYTAVFTPIISVKSYAYHVIANSEYLYHTGGTVSGTGIYDVADGNTPIDVTLTATPESENFTFLGWDDNQNNRIDEGEERNPVRNMQLTWADLAGKNYEFYTAALFIKTALVTVDYYEDGDQDLGSITVHDSDGNEFPLAELQAGRRFPVGTVLTLNATANADCRLRRWVRNSSTYSQESSITITVNATAYYNNYYADFGRLIAYQVSLAPDSPEGSSIIAKDQQLGTEIPLAGSFDLGQNIAVTVTLPEHNRVNWHDGNSQNIRTFTIGENPANNVFTAHIVPTYTVVLNKQPADSYGPHVSFSGGGSTRTFDLGTESFFYAGVYWGEYWRFVKWTDGNTQYNRSFNPENSDTYTFTAEFERYARIYANVASGNYYYAGSFSGTGEYAVTDTPKNVTVTATPAEGYRFDRWTDDGAANLADPGNPVRVVSISTADTSISLVANFVKTYQVSVGIYPGSENFGTITQGALSNATIDAGTQITFTATPNPGAQFIKWWLNGYAYQSMTEANQTVTVNGNLNYQAEFSSEADITISIAAGQEGWGCEAGVVNSEDNSLAPTGTYAVGYRYTIEARPAANHRFVRWSDGNTWPSRSIALTDAGITLTAIFAQTATITTDFKTDPAVLPDGIAFPYMYCSLSNQSKSYNYAFQKDNPEGNTRVCDAGTYTIRYTTHRDWIAPDEEEVTLKVGDNLVLDRTFTLITKGDLTGYLSPSEIAGAWRIKGTDDWLNSATTINIEAGDYTIEFQAVAGWLTPAERQVTVIANRSVSFNGIYSAVVPGVQLSFSPVEVSEAAGPNATIATLRRIALDGNPVDLSKPLTVHLSVSEKQALLLPANSILIPAGREFTQFPVGVIDNAVLEDFLLDEQQNQLGRGRLVTLSGTVAMAASCNCNGKPTDGVGERPIEADLILWDDDGPALSVVVSPSTLPERDELYAQALTVSRNDEAPGGDLLVTLTAYVSGAATADDGSEIQFWLGGARLPFAVENDPTASLVTIPDGQRSVKIDVLACNDGIEDGNQVVSIFADAAGYSPGAGWAMISDLSFPDYSIKNLLTPAQALESDSVHALPFTLFNGGNMDTPTGLQIPIAVHASRTNSISNDTLLMSSHIVVNNEHPLPKGGSMDTIFNVPLDNLAPANDWRFCVVVNPNGALREVSTFDNQTWSDQFPINASYNPQLDAIAEGTWILPDGSIELTGTVTKSATNPTPVAGVDLDVYVVAGDYRRVIPATSDANGAFSVTYTPAQAERGRIIAGACYPGTATNAKQQEFDVLGFGYYAGGKSYIFWNVTTDTPSHFSMTLRNPNANALTGIRGAVALPDPQLKLPVPNLDSIQAGFPDLPDTLAGGESVVINYSITATEATPGRDYQRPLLRFTSAEGAVLDIPTYFFAIPQFAKLSVDPVSIDTTMQIGVSRNIDITISNTGAIETGPITVTTPTLSWLTIASGANMASIPAGASATLTLRLRGDDTTELGMPLSGAIAINAANAQDGVRLPFRAMAVSEDKGSVRVSAVDEYTYYEEGNEPRLKNAGVTIKNPYTGAILGSGNTGEDAFCIIEDLPVGKALVVISADKHESATSIIDIAPGQQTKVELFLSFQAISYSWEVVPTEIEDEYEVVLTVVYETNVPMPVVRTEMPSDFTNMLPGTTRMVNAVLTNEGLIAAHNVRLDFYDAGSFTFECAQPDAGQTLLPQQATVLPVIVRRAASGTRASDPCRTWSATVYYYECGTDFKWHRYEKQIQLSVCPQSGGGSGWGGGGFSPGVPYVGTAQVIQPYIPSLPSLPNACVPCQNGLLNSALKCGLGFLPVGCVLGVVDAIISLKDNYNQGVEGWVNIGTDGTLAALGCVAEGTYGKFANILGCIRGFMSACDGLDGKPPTPWPVPGLGDGFTPSGTRANRAGGAPGWVEETQDIAFIGYRQAGHHAEALIEYYGKDTWLEAETAQLSAFNKVFQQMTIAGEDGKAPIIAENAPELIAVLPDNLSLEDLAAFVARWNRTMAYWQSLPGGPGSELPGDTDANGDPIISLAKLLGISNNIEQCEADAQEAGYENVHELVQAQYAYAQEQAKNSPSVCAKVTLEIKQKISMTREAFDGTLTMTNGHETLPITALGLAVKVTNDAGEDCTDLFEVLTLKDKFDGITAIDGTGTLAAKATGSAVLRFIPERGAAPETPVVYHFGGTLTYVNPFSGATATIELTPSTLTVNPSPSLQIRYFLQRDVLGDDPLTKTVIEPSYPAELSALVYNNGHGIAKNFRIDSGQPQIIDNEKGLLIDLALWDYDTEASMLNGQPNNAPLGQVNLGDIQPKTTALAQWWLTSSLLGHFVSMEAKYSHLNSNGNPELSLIESVDIHELIHSGKALDRDTVIFLVNDFNDAEDMPDTLWFQDTAQSAEVLVSNHTLRSGPTFNLGADPPTVTFQIEALQAGWHYIAMDDPANAGAMPGERRYEIAATFRNDTPTRADIELPFRNCWQTDRTIPDGADPINENRLHLIDYLDVGTYSYTVALTKLPEAAVKVAQFIAFSSNNEDVNNYIVAGDVDEVTVLFNTKIDPATFTTDDMTLRRQGVLIPAAELADSLSIQADPDDAFELSYVISGLSAFTSQDGFFVLTVQCAGIADPEGFFGTSGKQLMWVRQHDFGGDNAAAPSLFSMERIVPEAGMDGEFDVKLSFLGNIDPKTVTTDGLRLKKNGQIIALPEGVTIAQDGDSLGDFFIKGLDVLPAVVDFYSLRYDASGVKDILGTSCTGLRSVGWGNDVTPPEPIANLTLTPDTGLSPTDRVTQLAADELLTLAGTLPEMPCSYQLFAEPADGGDRDAVIDEIFVPEDGDNAMSIAFNLPEGAYTLILVLKDEAGNSTEQQLSLLIDNTAPQGLLNSGIDPDTGDNANDRITQLALADKLTFTAQASELPCRVVISCVADATGAVVNLGGTLNLSADDDDVFHFDVTGLAEGRYVITAVTTDLAGNSISEELPFLIDNTAPTFAGFTMQPDSGSAGDDFISQGDTFAFRIQSSETPVTIQIDLNGTAQEPINLTAVSYHVFTVDLAEGNHVIAVTLRDPAGNFTTKQQNVVVDNSAPAAITDLAIAPDTGTVGDFITQLAADDKLTLSGTLPEKLLTVTISKGESVLATKTCTGDEQAFALAFPLAEGAHALAITTTDRAGNSTVLNQTVLIDNTAPDAPANLAITPDTGVAGDFITQLAGDSKLTFSGTLPEKSLTVTIAEDGTVLATKTCEDDDQAFNLAFPLTEGSHDLVITTKDRAGNSTVLSQTVVIDNTAPAAMTDLAIAPDTGRSDSDLITSQNALPAPDAGTREGEKSQLFLTGTLPEKGLKVEWFRQTDEGEVSLGIQQYNQDDDAALNAALPYLPDATYTFVVRLTDAAGNSSDNVLADVVIDNTAPDAITDLAIAPDTGIAGDFITQQPEGTDLLLLGTLPEKNLIVTVAEGDTVLDTVTYEGNDFSMVFSFTEGTHHLTITAEDVAGNRTTLEQTVVIDNTAPDAITDLAITPDTGVAGDFITQLAADDQLTLSGALPETLLTVTVAENGTVLATKTCKDDDQAFSLAFNLAEGVHDLVITTEDVAGNSTTLEQTVVIDNTPPDAITNLEIAPDTGIAGDFITQQPEGSDVALLGILPEKHLTVTVAEGDTVLNTMTYEGDDFSMVFSFAEGTHHLVITTEDLAGNSTTLEQTVVIDNTPPAPVTGLVLTPDHGQSDTDGITWLAEDEKFALAFQLSESPVLVTLSYRVQGSEDCIVLYEEDHSAEAPQQLSIPVALRDEGSYTLILNIADLAGNQAEEVTLPLQVDATPLTVAISDMPTRPGDADSLTVTFSDDIADDEFTLDNIDLRFAGDPCPQLTLTRIDAKTYRISKFLEHVVDDGDLLLIITLDGIHKALSGLPGVGEHTEVWPFAFDNPGYNWQAGWNAVFLPFESILPSTEDGLAVMPRFKVANGAIAIANELPLRSALWIFCADPVAAPDLRGEFCADGEPIPTLTPGEWTFIGPLREIPVPEDTIAWEWRKGKYVQAQILLPGQAYWLFPVSQD
ncbi:MAG: Ig-like domain-containing protein [Lentisphaeria bacterium]|jgi:hypothetical protein